LIKKKEDFNNFLIKIKEDSITFELKMIFILKITLVYQSLIAPFSFQLWKIYKLILLRSPFLNV